MAASNRSGTEIVEGHRPYTIALNAVRASRCGLRSIIGKAISRGSRVGAWGTSSCRSSCSAAGWPILAYNPGKAEYPKASANYSDRLVASRAGHRRITNFLPTPMNRWTCYESPSEKDWSRIDFGKSSSFGGLNWPSTMTAAGCRLEGVRLGGLGRGSMEKVGGSQRWFPRFDGESWNSANFAP